MAHDQAVALSDEEVFGPASDEEVFPARVSLSPLEKAFEEIAEGARSSALGAAKATIEEATSKFEKITESIKERNAEIVTKAVQEALEKITAGARVDTSVIREIVGGIQMPSLDLSPLSDEVARIGKLVEGTHGAIAGSIRALREELLAAMREELKVEVKAPEAPAKPQEWDFDIQRDEDGAITAVHARAGSGAPRSALEAAQRNLKGH